MNWFEHVIWVALILILVMITLSSGCRFVSPVWDFVFKNPNAVVDEPGTAQEQLIDAAKGTNWLVAVSILGMGAGVFAFVNGSKIGIPVVVACAVSLFMALAVARFAMWMAVFGLIGAVLAVAISVLIKNKALKDVVTNVQEIKEIAKIDNVDLVFQDKIKNTLKEQANTTKKLVSKIRAKLSI